MNTALLHLLQKTLRLTRPRTFTPPRTLLILQYQMPLGCCVHGTPLYAAIKQANPSITLIVATRGLGLATLQHDPNIDHLIATPDPMTSRVAAWRVAQYLRRELRARHLAPDLILQDAANRAGTYALFALFLRLAPTAGFADAPALYDTHLPYNDHLSLLDNNLRLTALIGPQQPHTEPAVYFTASDLTTARTLLHEANPTNKPLAAFVLQGSGAQQTAWHDDRFAAVLAHTQSLGYQTIFLGTPPDTPAIGRIRALAQSNGASLAGRTSIPQLAAVLTLCDLLVSVDTGTMHVGRAAGLPMAVLAPTWQAAIEWLPLNLPQIRILRGADHFIEYGHVPPHYRLDEIQPPDVNQAITDLTTLYPPSPQARESRAQRLLTTTRTTQPHPPPTPPQ
jgi:ADP-heptose:LPS heptosyltransferase